MTETTPTIETRSVGAWWIGTWIVGVLAGSLASAALFAPRRPESDSDDGVVGNVLAAPIGVIAVSLLVLWGVYVGGMWLASQRIGSGRPARDYGVGFAPIDLAGIPIGVIGQLGLVWMVYLPLRSAWPDTFDEEALSQTARSLVERADGGLIVLLFALVVIGAPVVEELFFRGMLQYPLVSSLAPTRHQAMAVVGVAFVFAFVHFRPVEFPGLFAIGLVLGVCAWRTGRLGMSVVAHVAFNATGLVTVL